MDRKTVYPTRKNQKDQRMSRPASRKTVSKPSTRTRLGVASETVHFEEIFASWRHERPELELTNMLLTICLTRLGRMLEVRYENMSQQRFGIAGSDLRVLLALRRSGRPYARRPTDLFRALIVTSGAITKQVDRLVKKGLVARKADPLHGGGFLVHLTPLGLKVANASTDELANSSLIADGMRNLSAAERQAGVRFVEHLIREVERGYLPDRKAREGANGRLGSKRPSN